ncbi:hypothetical protein [Mitsuaria sp. 7]|uniref:hypothetical protein n=1 Tax=Mitsuaria sp. 7 TaxID=1658665 RepID=UPI0007DE12D2|nr:hypothetical protein [Mitsuaria sp. 7]ANH68486.1 hypothetical protein ABE85_14575 [Mitsuaria sp. 7]
MSNYLTPLAPFVPLLQTLAWITLIVALTLWFNRPIRELLGSLRKRVDAGSAVKAGWFELSEMKAEPADQQRLRAQIELKEASDGGTISAKGGGTRPTQNGTPPKYLLAEDLALRALQADLGVPLNRQISAGPSAGFDAAFAQGGKLNIVEVRFFPGPANPEGIRLALERIADTTERMNWKSVKVILVLVFAQPGDVYLPTDPINKALEGFRLSVDVRTYSLDELRIRFGVAPGDL